MARQTTRLPAVQITTMGRATRAESDAQLLESWIASLTSAHSRRNFEVTARRFLAELPTVEDTRDALDRITRDVSEATGRQYVLRVKSLLGYAHRLGYAPFNAGATIKVRSDTRNRGATLAKRIIPEVEVHLLMRGARTKRDRVLLEVLYAGGLRVSELAGLTWLDVLARDKGQVQLSVVGKGGVVRQVLLPEAVSRALLSLRGDAGADDAVFASRKTDARLTEGAVLGIAKPSVRQPAPASMRLSHPLAETCPRESCHRPRRHAPGGVINPRPRQHRHDERLPGCAPREFWAPRLRTRW